MTLIPRFGPRSERQLGTLLSCQQLRRFDKAANLLASLSHLYYPKSPTGLSRRRWGGISVRASQAEVVAGIDLGTTNSCIAVTSGNDVQVVPDSDGSLTVPSVVAFLEDGDISVGRSAKRNARRSPASTFYSAKRFIGRGLDTATHDADRVAFGVTADAEGLASFECSQADSGEVYFCFISTVHNREEQETYQLPARLNPISNSNDYYRI